MEEMKKNGTEDQVALDSLLARLAEDTSSRSAPPEIRRILQAEAEAAHSSSHSGRLAGRAPRNRLQTAPWITATVIATIGIAAMITLILAAGNFLAYTRTKLSERASLKYVSPESQDSASSFDDTQTATPAGYVSLPYSDPSMANGTEATVRVSVPTSQLMAWGVPSLARGPDEDVPADLVLGDDGLPQAIRILPITSSTSTAEESYP